MAEDETQSDVAGHRVTMHESYARGDDGILRRVVFDPPIVVDPGDLFFGSDYVLAHGTKYQMEPVPIRVEAVDPPDLQP